MNLNIRRAQTADAQAIAAILRELDWFAHLASETLETTQMRVSQHLEMCLANDSHSVYVAQTEPSEIMGYVAVHWMPTLFLSGPEGFVSELFIKTSARGLGIGSKLLAAVKAEAETRGCARLSLINIRHRESYKQGFYRKQGWQERETAANFIYPLTEK